MKTFRTAFFKSGKVWIGFALDLPGATTQGHTLQEARENLEEAIQLVLETLDWQWKKLVPCGSLG